MKTFARGVTVLVAVLSGVFLLKGCGSQDEDDVPEIDSQRHQLKIQADSAAAKPIVDAIKEFYELVASGDLWGSKLARAVLPHSGVDQMERVNSKLTPKPKGKAAKHATKTTFPDLITDPLHLDDLDSGVALDVTLETKLHSPAEFADGYVAFRGALPGNVHLLHNMSSSGTEEFFLFETPPSQAEVSKRERLETCDFSV